MNQRGGYEILRTKDKIDITILSSGSETSLACKICHKLATENIYSKVISMPCQELFDKQNNNYKNKILKETPTSSIYRSLRDKLLEKIHRYERIKFWN